jgi:hypothetical protein
MPNIKRSIEMRKLIDRILTWYEKSVLKDSFGRFGTVRYDDEKIREMAFSWLPEEAPDRAPKHIRTIPPNIFINHSPDEPQFEYEWWCVSNTPWEEVEYYNAPYGSIYDVYKIIRPSGITLDNWEKYLLALEKARKSQPL